MASPCSFVPSRASSREKLAFCKPQIVTVSLAAGK